MKVAFGMKAHSGWAALVVLGKQGAELVVVDRRRIELVEERDASWAKQPYHAAENLDLAEARILVRRAIERARRLAVRELKKASKRASDSGHKITACAVLSVDPMPDWTVGQILAVHFRMHKAEGVLFREALAGAAKTCKLKLVRIPEKQLDEYAESELGSAPVKLRKTIASLGKSVGPPWGSDQKDAALAALIALHDQ